MAYWDMPRRVTPMNYAPSTRAPLFKLRSMETVWYRSGDESSKVTFRSKESRQESQTRVSLLSLPSSQIVCCQRVSTELINSTDKTIT